MRSQNEDLEGLVRMSSFFLYKEERRRAGDERIRIPDGGVLPVLRVLFSSEIDLTGKVRPEPFPSNGPSLHPGRAAVNL